MENKALFTPLKVEYFSCLSPKSKKGALAKEVARPTDQMKDCRPGLGHTAGTQHISYLQFSTGTTSSNTRHSAQNRKKLHCDK